MLNNYVQAEPTANTCTSNNTPGKLVAEALNPSVMPVWQEIPPPSPQEIVSPQDCIPHTANYVKMSSSFETTLLLGP